MRRDGKAAQRVLIGSPEIKLIALAERSKAVAQAAIP